MKKKSRKNAGYGVLQTPNIYIYKEVIDDSPWCF